MNARRRRRLSCLVCQLIGSGLVPRDVIYLFVQVTVNTRAIERAAARRRAGDRASWSEGEGSRCVARTAEQRGKGRGRHTSGLGPSLRGPARAEPCWVAQRGRGATPRRGSDPADGTRNITRSGLP